MIRQFGVRGRLLMAFFGISAFAVLAAAAAMYSFLEVDQVLERITQQRVPSTLASLELSRQAERIVAAAPALLASDSQTRHEQVSTAIAGEVERLGVLLTALKTNTIDSTALEALESPVGDLRANLDALDQLVDKRLAVNERKEKLLRRLSSTTIATQRLTAPGLLVMDSKISQWRRANTEASADTPQQSAAMIELAEAISSFLPQQKAQVEISSINDTLIKAAGAESPADLPLLAFPLRRSLQSLEILANDFDLKLQPRLLDRINEFRGFIDGDESILKAREDELNILAEGEQLLAENRQLSQQLTEAVDLLVGGAKQDIDRSNQEVTSAQNFSMLILVAVVGLSLISSVLIVWFYVNRNLVSRLTALSNSMLAIAGGNLHTELPRTGADEIGRMGEALRVFRDTAIEEAETQALNEQLKAENLRMGAELEVTRKLQKILLPQDAELQYLDGLDIAAYMEPADEVGGDYYDVLKANGRLKIGIGDVTGHGLESGVVMLMTQTAVRTLLNSGETDPVRFLEALNRTIYDNLQRMGADKHLTLSLLDFSPGEIRLSGQHEELLLVRRDGTVERVDTMDLGFPIGLLERIDQYIQPLTLPLQPGDGVVLYTDGIIEAANDSGEMYGLERLCDIVGQHWQESAETIKQHVIADVQRYIGEQRVDDDITLLVVKQT